MIEQLKNNNIEYKTNVSNGYININCPFCNDSKYHLGYSIKDNYWTCFRCGWHSNKEVEDALGIISTDTNKRVVVVKSKVQSIKMPMYELSVQAKQYLASRGFDVDLLVNTYKLYDGSIVGDYKFRIIIPVYQNKQLVCFSSRSYKGVEPRYKHLRKDQSIIEIKSTLYNLDNCSSNEVVVLEGPIDVWKWGNNSVCTYGIEMTEKQIELLRKFKVVRFLYDNEDLAQQKAKKYCQKLNMYGVQCYIHRLKDKKDIGECSITEVNEIKKTLGV